MGNTMITTQLSKKTIFVRLNKKAFLPTRKSFSRGMISVMAKYGDESVYFDLNDMENTAGSWEMYGQDGKKRYPALQEDFFIRAGQALNRRAAMLAFCAMSGTVAVLAWGAKGSIDAKLPITVGPQKNTQG